MTKILIFSGGRGSINLIKSLKKIDDKFFINSLVNTYDDGKSSGVIRDIFDIPGPSDIRKIQEINLERENKNYKLFKKIFSKRINLSYLKFLLLFSQYLNTNNNNLFGILINDFKINSILKKYLRAIKDLDKKNYFETSDFSLFNLIFAGAYFYYEKNINKTINSLSNLFSLKNKVFSCGTKNLYLCGINKKNKIYKSEAEIVENRSNVNMKHIFLMKKKLLLNEKTNSQKIKKIYSESVRDNISSEAKKLIKQSNIIIYSAGTPYSSLYPSYFCKGVGKLINANKKAKKILIINIGSDYETPDFIANDYIKNTLNYLSFDNNFSPNNLITHILVNSPKNNNPSYVKPIISNKFKSIFNIIHTDFESHKNSGLHSSVILTKVLKNLVK